MFAPRLSIPLAYRSCRQEEPPPGSTIPVAACGTPERGGRRSDTVRDLARRVNAAVDTAPDPGALHAAGLFEMVWTDGSEARLQRAVSYLHTAAALVERPAPHYADLSAALIVRAERTQSARDLYEAIEAAEQALEAEPSNVAARFNLALALDRLGLDAEAARAWREFLRVDPSSGWAAEARSMLDAISRRQGPAPPPPGASAAELAAHARRAPQEARVLALDSLLGEWGEAVLRGDGTQAEASLRAAAAIGAALERGGRDATVADVVRAIRAASGSGESTRRLAEALRAYAAGQAAYHDNRRSDAALWFAQAQAAASGSPALAHWAWTFRGASLVYLGKPEGERFLRESVDAADTVRHPALAGRARWMLGTTLLRGGRWEEALTRYRDAARYLERAGEREHLGAVQFMIGETEFALGDAPAAYASMHRALMTLRAYRRSVWLHDALYVTAQSAAAGSLFRAATRIQGEGVAVAARMGRDFYLAEALLLRARLLADQGRTARASADVSAARERIARLPVGAERAWAHADLRLAETGLRLAGETLTPAQAARALDSVVPFFDRNSVRLLPALVRRADARLWLGQLRAAEADLDRATMVLDTLSGRIENVATRAMMIEAARGVVDRLVMLRVNAGRPTEALAYLERGRASLAPAGRALPFRARKRIAAPEGQVVVEYALIGDTLLTWTVAGTTVHLERRRVARGDLLKRIEGVRSSLERRAGAAAVRVDLGALHDVLIGPVRERLGAAGTPLVVIADGEIAMVPFEALFNGRGGRYLVESHPLRFASSIADGGLPPRRRGVPPAKALFVADPAFDTREYPGLQPLPATAARIRTLVTGYGGAMLLEGTAAHRDTLRAVLRQARLFHFGGHAVFDDERPNLSYLVLASRTGDSGRLTAAEIQAMDFRHLELVVLSACQTQRPRSGRTGGFAGLTEAMLAAGAGGVVGSLWRVSEETTNELMASFHREYRASGDGAVALRRAQLSLLRSPDARLHSPAAWAGFRYAGR